MLADPYCPDSLKLSLGCSEPYAVQRGASANTRALLSSADRDYYGSADTPGENCGLRLAATIACTHVSGMVE